MSFWKYFGTKFFFQKIYITTNKITASINTLLLILLPATTQVATITHGDAKLHVNYSDLLMYMIQIIVIMVVFSTIVWICIQIWNCINTRNLGKLYDNLNVMQFLYDQVIYSVYLHSVYDNPKRIEMIGHLMNGDVTLFKGCVLTI